MTQTADKDYRYTYEVDDYGTVRVLTVYGPDAAVVGRCDPFWGLPMPTDDRKRAAAVRSRAAGIARAHWACTYQATETGASAALDSTTGQGTKESRHGRKD